MSLDYREKIIAMIEDAVPGIILRTDAGDGYWDDNNEVCLSVLGMSSGMTSSYNRIVYEVYLRCSARCYNSYMAGSFMSMGGGYYIEDNSKYRLSCEGVEYKSWNKSMEIKLNAHFTILTDEAGRDIEVDEKILPLNESACFLAPTGALYFKALSLEDTYYVRFAEHEDAPRVFKNILFTKEAHRLTSGTKIIIEV